jgi:hypothetical protein
MGERRVAVNDDYDAAWEYAADILREAHDRDVWDIQVAVRRVTVFTGIRRRKRVWGIFVTRPDNAKAHPQYESGPDFSRRG